MAIMRLIVASRRAAASLSLYCSSEDFRVMTEPGPPEELPPPYVLGILNLTKHAEAGQVLIVAGIVEDWLQTLLLGAGRQLSNTLLSQFFEGYGPLSSFSAKIDIA